MMTETIDIRASLPENSRLLEQTGEFIRSLLQAFLRTGYYLPDHPEAHKAKAGLYGMFARLVEQNGEITFLIAEERGANTILIEGVTPPPLRLYNIMQRGMSETYTPKFVQFLQRKELIALSLNARMDEGEFSRFVDIMSEPSHGDMKDATAKQWFVQALRERQIFNLSFIFGEEFITTRHNVPWRTRMALSRLKKDIRLLPILRNLPDNELHQIKLQILTDLLRPLGVAELVYSFLINLDLAASPLMSEEDGEQYVFKLTGERLIMMVANLFVEDVKGGAHRFPEHVTEQKKGRILAGICQRLNASKDPKAVAMLEVLFDIGMIPLEALPEQIRVRVLTIKRVTTFLMKPEKFLQAIDLVTEPDIYSFRAQTVISFVPYLIEREKLQEAIDIVELINKHVREGSARSTCAIQRRAQLVFGETLGLASRIFLTASKETRTLIGQLFQLIGHGAIPHLKSILIESDDLWRSKQAAEALISMGDKAIEGMISAVDGSVLSSTSIAVVLRTLSDGPPRGYSSGHKREIIRILVKYAGSRDSDIRREALSGLCRLSPVSGFNLFRSAAAGSDPRIKKIATRGLGLAGDRRAVELLAGLIETAEKTDNPESHELGAVAVESLGSLMDSCPAAKTAVLTYLGALVDRYCGGSWKKILPSAFVAPAPILLTLTELIGKLHGPAVRSQLTRLSNHRNQDVAKRAAEFLGNAG